jgi:uncharacterized protein (TIGR02271 family)
MAKTVVGLFDDFSEAQAAVRDLVDAGIPRENISIAANDVKGEYVAGDTDDAGSAAASGAVTGATGGAIVGGLGGLLLGLGVFAIPGLGPIVAAGPLVATLTGAGIGAAAGGLIGALTGMGVPEEEAGYYAEGVRRGGALVTVSTTDDMARQTADIMHDHDVVDIDERASQWRQAGWAGYDANAPKLTAEEVRRDREQYRTPAIAQSATMAPPATASQAPSSVDVNRVNAGEAEARLPVVEENVEVGKREVQRGGVRVYSHVTEKPVQEQLNLREERVNVERRPVDRPASEADFQTFKEGTIEVTETAEEPVVQKQARVVEEVVVGKDVQERTETVKDTVRRTDVQVENLGAQDFSTYESDFRNNFQTTYGGKGATYEQYAPAYRYGYEVARDPRYSNRDWNAVESDLRRDWESRGQGSWDTYRDSVRYAWERARSSASNMGARAEGMVGGNQVPGIQTGGQNDDGSPDTRGILEKISDAVTGDRTDDKTGKPI